jgi:hypothetical protein
MCVFNEKFNLINGEITRYIYRVSLSNSRHLFVNGLVLFLLVILLAFFNQFICQNKYCIWSISRVKFSHIFSQYFLGLDKLIFQKI